MKKRILVVAAHPDDEILGCGGTLARFRDEGNKIQTVFFTNGISSRNDKVSKKAIEIRKKNALLVAKKLKSNEPIFFDYPDNQLDTIPLLKIIKKIEKVLKNFKPNIIFTHFDKDLNIDHQVVSKAVTTATRPLSGSKLEMILFFEILSSTEWTYQNNKDSFTPNYFINIEKFISKKKDLLKIYREELREWPHSRSLRGTEILSNYRGMMSGTSNAEAFILSKKFLR